jgi:xylulokinase
VTDLAPPFVIGIDLGTQSVRAIAFDARGRRAAQAGRPTPVRRLEGGGEHDPDALFDAVLACLTEVAAGLRGGAVAGVAVASMGESCVLVDASGRAVAPAIVWHDRRTAEAAKAIAARFGPERVFAVTGQPIDPTLTLAKLLWMRRHWPDAMTRTRRILMLADWIAFRLSGEAATDATLASRTLYLDIHRRAWSAELLALAGLDADIPAPLAASGTPLGPVRRDILERTGLAGTPVVGVGGHDHLCGSYAAGVTAPGIALNSLGTAEFLTLATAAPLGEPALVGQGFIQGAIALHRPLNYIGGGINMSGGSIEWFRAATGGAAHAALIAEAEVVPPGSNGVLFLPHLVFSPPPDLDPAGRGGFLGLTPEASRGALYRAVLEGLAMQTRLMLEAMTAAPGVDRPRQLRVIGGTSRNALFLAIKAAVFARPLTVIDEPEATSLGAALLGGIAGGLWPDLDAALASLERREHVVAPDAALAQRYDALHRSLFERFRTLLRPVNHALAAAPTD